MILSDAYKTDIDIQFGGLSEMVGWCQTNCNGDWGYRVLEYAGQRAGSYQFNFEYQKDFVNFILWKK
jgi:hypothetical protein